MSAFSRFTPLISALPSTVPFVGPEAIERQRGRAVLARIGANENGFGPAPSVLAAMREEARDIWKYNDPENFALREALGAHLGVTSANIAIAGGIDELLGQIVRLVIEPGAPVVTSLGAYPTFNFHVAGFGGRLVTVPYANDREDLDGLLDAVRREKAPLVYFANPDNPMGSWWDADSIVAFARALPETTMMVLDEAYSETGPANSLPSIASLINLPNIVRTRTFSKAYGLAGSRTGYVISTSGTAQAFDKIRNHFGMNRLATAAALAALKDQAYLAEVIGKIHAARERIGRIARANGLEPLASATNFVAIDTGHDGAYARAIVDGLIEHGVFIRMPGVAPLNRCIRVSVGPEADMALFEEALPQVLKTLA
ncbi:MULTISPECIES: pyridoxal phosphate-dependent aminotransferase [Rhizobium]|uniref:pyridoxal phosphate-dependent aminotransferase n=1 Tax=Rhizobium TaxID=379 RepID=UPI001B32A0E7|nr:MULTISPECIES: pyridoxal phosphate-dependent aminotransferase [Rhizobium]MBX4911758.1 pyridoxal phosphate-dependent aminotransferase [Rhizobium bangladeshense]MBX5218520.1 pyridoxal phosphate-dependent aminotransferase [Rhizobium sp. NLR9a]MBX5230222.1 pyridoxal phosphate-dependent aminotransferase [Rhizobium sp. NLR9b]MBX5236471.1 pyridoxal phosphate-dependent aminotransferase [Rhizobium sp. NLR4a]MBX5248557.1 pyridoxal phosphate-dependent aminotransferase [Rhizobium sp. NLR3b]